MHCIAYILSDITESCCKNSRGTKCCTFVIRSIYLKCFTFVDYVQMWILNQIFLVPRKSHAQKTHSRRNPALPFAQCSKPALRAGIAITNFHQSRSRTKCSDSSNFRFTQHVYSVFILKIFIICGFTSSVRKKLFGKELEVLFSKELDRLFDLLYFCKVRSSHYLLCTFIYYLSFSTFSG